MLTRRDFFGASAGGLAFTARPDIAASGPVPIINDASGLNPTPVAKHWVVSNEDHSQLLAALRRELKAASVERRAVSLGCARHSMGGQSLHRGSTSITFEDGSCEVDTAGRRYKISAGTRWWQVIKTLDPIGFSPTSMQSNNDFGIAAALSVNAHGWPVRHGPVGATVLALDVMLADGAVLTCSATRNAELFRLVIGGYGLFGIVVGAELSMVENGFIQPYFARMPTADIGPRFVKTIQSDHQVSLAYARLSVDRERMFDDALLVAFRAIPRREKLPAADKGSLLASLEGSIFRSQIGSDSAKARRWWLETMIGPRVAGKTTRNALLNLPVASLGPSPKGRVDILHEYFVPPDRLADFLGDARDAILRSRQDCLNVTIRYVAADSSSLLSYAPQERLGAVMLFSQERTIEAEHDMKKMTHALIEASLSVGGSFYLLYRLHATREQVKKAYAETAQFIGRKRHYDPGLMFRNMMWDVYFG